MRIGHNLAFSIRIHRLKKWRVMTSDPDAVPWYGIWCGGSKDGEFLWIGFYAFPFALRTSRRRKEREGEQVMDGRVASLVDALEISDKAWEAESGGKLSGVTRADIWTLIVAICDRDRQLAERDKTIAALDETVRCYTEGFYRFEEQNTVMLSALEWIESWMGDQEHDLSVWDREIFDKVRDAIATVTGIQTEGSDAE